MHNASNEAMADESASPRTTDVALLALRLGTAGLMLGFHGDARLLRAFDYVARGEPWTFVNVVHELGFPLAPVFAVASALAESVGSVLVALGLWTRVAAGALATNMLVALLNEWIGGDPIELPALYFVASLTIVLAGAGRHSVDVLRVRRRARRERSVAADARVSTAVRASNAR